MILDNPRELAVDLSCMQRLVGCADTRSKKEFNLELHLDQPSLGRQVPADGGISHFFAASRLLVDLVETWGQVLRSRPCTEGVPSCCAGGGQGHRGVANNFDKLNVSTKPHCRWSSSSQYVVPEANGGKLFLAPCRIMSCSIRVHVMTL